VFITGHFFLPRLQSSVRLCFIIFVDRMFTSFSEPAFTSILDASAKMPQSLACIIGTTPINSPAT
jgi:hypothetical protein